MWYVVIDYVADQKLVTELFEKYIVPTYHAALQVVSDCLEKSRLGKFSISKIHITEMTTVVE